jgi:demethylsterigmatocystin 6-O-methyltransferase
MQPLPKYLSATSYVSPKEPNSLPFNLAFGPELFFHWLPKHPDVLKHFQEWMAVQREGHTPWLDFYPFDQQIIRGFETSDPNSVILVDVGGNIGHEILEIKRRYPSIPGRAILQDLPSTIDQVGPKEEFEAMSHDFFTPQPVQGMHCQLFRRLFMRNH